MTNIDRIKQLRKEGHSMQEARLLAEREEMTEALFKASVDENLRWVIQRLIDRMPDDGTD